MSVNLWVGVGNLTADPEMKYTDGGTAKTRFGIAINKPGRRDDRRDDEPLYVNVECWDKLAETVAEYARKGRKVFIQGELMRDTWRDRDSDAKRERWYVKARVVQFLDRAPDRDDEPPRRRERDDGRRRPTRSRARHDDRDTRYEGRDPEPTTPEPDDEGLPF